MAVEEELKKVQAILGLVLYSHNLYTNIKGVREHGEGKKVALPKFIFKISYFILVLFMKRFLFLTENGFEDIELMYPYYRFQEAGYQVDVVGPKAKGNYTGKHGLSIKVDLAPKEVS